MVMMMKRMWILILAIAVAIPGLPAMASGSVQHTGYWRIGQFNYTNGFADGRFVSFHIDESTGEIENYMVNGTLIFKSVTYENETQGNVWIRGASLLYYGMGAKINFTNPKQGKLNFMWRFIHAHDTPAGVFHIVVYGGDTITYKLANGIQAVRKGEHMITLNGTVTGVLIFTGNAVLENGEILVNLGVKNYTFGNYEFKGGSVIFIRTGGWHIPSRIKSKILNAIQQGKIGGEMDINNRASDFINYTYGMHANVKSREINKIQISVNSENPQGKVIMVNADKSTLNYDSHHRIIVKIDGKEIKEESEDSVISGGSEGKYAVVDAGKSVTLLIYVPHFSSHSLDIESQERSTNTVMDIVQNPLILGVIAIVIILIIVGIAILIKRR